MPNIEYTGNDVFRDTEGELWARHQDGWRKVVQNEGVPAWGHFVYAVPSIERDGWVKLDPSERQTVLLPEHDKLLWED